MAENEQANFLETVRQQIKWQAAWPGISAELADHLAEHKAELLAQGAAVEAAEAQAVEAMGDAEEIGRSLDELHRPQLAKGLLALGSVLIISSLASIVYALTQGYQLLLPRTLLGVAGGVILAGVIYFSDYSKWLKNSAVLYGIGLALLAAVILFGREINGRSLYLGVGLFNINGNSLAALLFVAAVAGFLVLLRDNGLGGLLRCGVLAAISVGLVLRGDLNLAVVMAFWYVALFTRAIGWGYFSSRRWLNYAVVYSAVGAVWAGIAAFILAGPWRLNRMIGFLHPFENIEGGGWAATRAILTLQQARLVGGADLSVLGENANAYPAILIEPMSNYTFMRLINDFGLLAGALAAGGLLLLIYAGWRKMRQVKNHYGQLLGLSALALLGGQSLCHILMNVGFYLTLNVPLPFFSAGGTNMLVSCLLLGVILAVWRRNTILLEGEPPSRKIDQQRESIVQWSQGCLMINFRCLFGVKDTAEQQTEGRERDDY